MPGGHIDFGESLEEGVIRELLEETGIQIDLSYSEKSEPLYHFEGESVKMEPFYVFESVSYFALDAKTPPAGGHLIVFFKI